MVHDALNFGHCHLAVAVPQGWSTVNTIEDLKNLGWSAQRPMRVVTGYTHVRFPPLHSASARWGKATRPGLRLS